MKITMLWEGGYSYAPSMPDDLEHFDSLREAVDACRYRESGSDSYYPCVEYGEGAYAARLYRGHLTASDLEGDAYPDYVIEVGPRGGMRAVPA